MASCLLLLVLLGFPCYFYISLLIRAEKQKTNSVIQLNLRLIAAKNSLKKALLDKDTVIYELSEFEIKLSEAEASEAQKDEKINELKEKNQNRQQIINQTNKDLEKLKLSEAELIKSLNTSLLESNSLKEALAAQIAEFNTSNMSKTSLMKEVDDLNVELEFCRIVSRWKNEMIRMNL